MRRLTPYLLLAILTLGAGLGVGLGLSEAPTASPRLWSDHLELSATRVTGGQDIRGWLVIEHEGGAPATGRQRCVPAFGVALVNKHYHQDLVFPLDCRLGAFVLPQGSTRLPITIFTTYLACSASPAEPSTPGIPHCLAHNEQPPIPAGRYFTKMVWTVRVPLPTPPSVTVTVLRGR